MSKVKLRARYSGNREVVYRWVCAVDDAALVHAQRHPEAESVEDSWSPQVDDRIVRKTVVRLPCGLLVLDSTHKGGGHAYAAGVLREGKTPGSGDVDWSRARYVETIPPDEKKRTPRKHVIDVDGKRRTYIEA